MKKKRRKFMWLLSLFFVLCSSYVFYYYFPEITCSYFINKSFKKVNLHLKKIDIDGETYSYAEGGEGPTLVLVHGFQGDKRFWLKYVKSLIKDYHVILPDLPAHGGSSCSIDQKFDLCSLAKTLDKFVDAKNLDSFCLAGTSLGGGVVSRYSHLYPEKVEKLILINPIGIKPETESEYLDLIASNKKLFFPKTIKDLDNLYIYLMGAPLDLIKPFKRYILDYLIEKKPVFKRVYKELTHGQPLNNLLNEIKTPTLLLFGKHDKVSRPVDFDIFASSLVNCRPVMINDGFHIFKDNAFDKAMDEIQVFLSNDQMDFGEIIYK